MLYFLIATAAALRLQVERAALAPPRVEAAPLLVRSREVVRA